VARGIQGTRTDWWAGISLHHDHWLPVTGLCVGAVSISGEVPDAAAWLDYLMGVFKADLSAVGDDGSWTEGTADWVYAMNMTYMLCDAYRSLTGVNMFDLPFIRNGSMYRLYNWLPNDTYVYHHDSHPDGRYNVMGFASCHLLRKLAAELQDGRAQWLAEREEQRDLDRGRAVTPREDWMVNKSHTVPAHQCVAWNFLWYDPAVRPQPPEGLPLHRCFPNQGLVILRSGWGPEDVVFSFTCAPAGGHAGRAAVLAGDERMGNGITHVHARANSFDLFVNGNYLAIPPGYGERPSTSENTLTIEGAAQRLNPRYAAALVRQDFQGGYCYFAGDATDCYPEEIGLKRWLRHVAYLPPDVFLICDELAAAASVASGKATRWQLDFNPDLNDAQIDQARQTVTILSQASPAEKGAMTVAFLHPQGLAIEKAVLRNPQRGYVRFGQVTAQLQDIFGSSQNPQILAVLFPLKNASASPPAVRAVKGDALLGAVVDRKDESQCALFCLGDARSAEARRLQAKLLGKPKLTCYLFGLEPNEGYDVSCVAGAGGDGLAAYDLLVRKGGRVIANDAGSVCVRSASAIASGPAAARAE
jgi:hypothetical protein